MSRGPENTFRAGLHKYLDPDLVYQEKMHNPFRGGTADDWYSGRRQHARQKTRDLWIEWKYVELPKRDGTLIDLVGGKDPTIAALQQEWIKKRQADGRNVWVGVGCKEGGVILTGLLWQRPLTTAVFRGMLQSRKELAERITEFVQGSS